MKKAQFWYGDFLVAVLILMIIGILFVISIKDITSRNEILKDLTLEASDISSVLMTEGYGTRDDWNNGIGVVGVISNNKLDYVKFNNFLNINSYNAQRVMFGALDNVWVYLEKKDGTIIDGNHDKIVHDLDLDYNINSVSDINSNNLIHIKRFVFCNQGLCDDGYGKGDIYIVGVVVWQ